MTVPDTASPALPNRRLELLTCSMARDLDLFGLLARSIDTHVTDGTHHNVVVPGADLAAFRPYETAHRTIIAQEDVLPVKFWKLPSALRHLAFLKPGFRRPLYLTPDRRVVRGWMLQQLLKIQMSANTDCAAIMHIDSDVSFFRNFTAAEAFDGEKVIYFQALGSTGNPMHWPWIKASCQTLGIDVPAEHPAHYVENCVLWSTDTLRAMIARIEEVHGMPFYKVLFGAPTMSEYYLYGIFADLIAHHEGLVPEDISFCNSYWPETETDEVDFASLRTRLHPKHCAMAIQSTHRIDLATRARIYERASRELALT